MTSLDPVLNDLRSYMAKNQFIAGRSELIARGFSPSRINNWIRHGRLVRVATGVYAYGRDVEIRTAAWRAALILGGPGSALGGVSACEAWGIIKPRSDIPALIEVAAPEGKARILHGRSPALSRTSIRIVGRALDPFELTRKEGLKLTTAPRALIDFAADAAQRDVSFAFLEACRLGLFGRPDVDYGFRRCAGRRGATKLRPLFASWEPELLRTRSVLEGLFLLEWIRHGLDMPLVNVRLHGFEVDLYWSESNLVLELDGGAFHSDSLAIKRDIAKTRELESRGLRVIRISYREFDSDPAGAVRRVRDLL